MVGFAIMALDTLRDKPQSLSPAETRSVRPDWQSVLAEAVRNPVELCQLLGLDRRLATESRPAAGDYPLFVPRPFLARIRPGDPNDPLLLQVLPTAAETLAAPGFGTDPVGDADACCGSGLIRKYQGRILMVASRSCAVHCRFCFRRHSPFCGGVSGLENPCSGRACPPCQTEEAAALQKIASDDSIHEVVLSGGDPLTLPDDELVRLVCELAEIPHLRRLRIHTRFPIMIPQRVTADLIALLRGARLPVVVVIHINHPAEIDGEVAESLERFVDAGIPMLSQTVLLRGVNDRADVLAELFERLVDLRVMPYYLHQLDRVAGAAHFEVPISVGCELMKELRARLPGYAVPRYVRELPGGTNKELLA